MIRPMRVVLMTIGLLLGATAVDAAAAAQPAEGNWLTQKRDGIIEIFRCDGETLCGKLAWFRIRPDDPNPQALDLNNPDPTLRNRSLCGLVFMTGFKPVGSDSWEEGAVYDPDSGKTYHATMKLRADGTLDLHGYIGISLIGRSEIWTRDARPVPACPSR